MEIGSKTTTTNGRYWDVTMVEPMKSDYGWKMRMGDGLQWHSELQRKRLNS